MFEFVFVLSSEENKLLTEVGRATPMGDLLRRYWHPIAAVSELEDHPIKSVRLFGEDLVLFKDMSGSYGLLDRRCPHRGADLSYGRIEPVGLRCNYHGWCFDPGGRCIEQPFEETVHPKAKFKERVKATSYRVEAKGGLLWANLGPEPAPLVPDWEFFSWKNGFVQLVFAEIPCNWLQCQENSIDPIHFEWLHVKASTIAERSSERAERAAQIFSQRGVQKHMKLKFEEFDHGFIYKRLLEGWEETEEGWTIGRACLWPNAFFTGRCEWRVPIDDQNTLSVLWHYARVPKEQEPFEQERIPYWYAPIRDPKTNRWITTHNMNEDITAWVGQGVISDRTKEHLGESDRGVIMFRRKLFEQLDVIAAGGDPKGILRDPEKNRALALPMMNRNALVVEGRHRAAYGDTPPEYFTFAGQPPEVREQYLRAMGFVDATDKSTG